jgi:hypothetical protein
MATLFALLLGIALILATITIHYEALRAISGLIPKLSVPPRARILLVIGGVFIGHFLKIVLYAVVFAVMQNRFGLGAISGVLEGNPLDFLYLSISSYTTLGVGDVYPTGPLRLVAAIESLNGLVLIGWSASFTYLAMERFWQAHGGRKKS